MYATKALTRSCCLRSTFTVTCLSTLTITTSSIMPKPPLRYHGANKIDLSDLSAKVAADFEKREEAFKVSRKMQADLIQIRDQIGTPEAATALENFQTTFASHIPQDKQSDRTLREANLSYKMEEFMRLLSYQHFLETGKLVSLPTLCSDEEYLGGAIMGLARELQSYGLGRATVRDADSVQAACDLTAACLDFLLELDFRNGPLRRKYDGTKYSLKALETLLYELAITTKSVSTASANREHAEEERASKKPKPEGDSLLLLLPTEDLQAIKGRMEHRDELRETLIKKCRDGQKAAKQCIFALHRGDRARAVALLQQCAKSIKQELFPIVQEEPPLRYGSFANVLEEYVEAKLFAVWLHGKEVMTEDPMQQEEDASAKSSSGIILKPEDFTDDIIPLEPEEYIGGLCDLTGEIGRYAVQRGTARDVDGVKLCLQANGSVFKSLQMMERMPANCGKKLDALRNSVEKLERMLYEMSLSEAAGGRPVHTDVKMEDKQEE